MLAPLVSIDSNFEVLNESEVTASVIDAHICTKSMNLLDVVKRKKHVLQLVTHNMNYWERLVESASILYWLKKDGCGWAVYLPNQDCGYTRIYRYKPSIDNDVRRVVPWEFGSWKQIQSEEVLLSILDSVENTVLFDNWKNHQLSVYKTPTEFAEGRLANTTVGKVMLVAKGNGCAVCGDFADHHATTSIGGESTVMLSISLCETHRNDSMKHPCVLTFFGTLFYLKLEIPNIVKSDRIPDELVRSICEVIASKLSADYECPEKREGGWHVRFVMNDGWSWLLRLNTLTDYAYMLFDSSKKQRHRIDSAADHPDVPFGPDHQHFNPKTKREKIESSFSYGMPIFDFPLLKSSRAKHE